MNRANKNMDTLADDYKYESHLTKMYNYKQIKKQINFIVIIVALIINSQLLFAQQDTSAIKFYKPSEIPVKIENATSFLVQQKSGVLSASMVIAAEKMLKSFEKGFDKLNAISDTASINNYNSVQLRNINHRWIALQSQLGQSLIQISARTKVLENEKDYIQTMQDTWQHTREQDVEKEIPNELLNSVNNLEIEINVSLEILNAESNDLLSIQSGFSNKNITIETKLITI